MEGPRHPICQKLKSSYFDTIKSLNPMCGEKGKKQGKMHENKNFSVFFVVQKVLRSYIVTLVLISIQFWCYPLGSFDDFTDFVKIISEKRKIEK